MAKSVSKTPLSRSAAIPSRSRFSSAFCSRRPLACTNHTSSRSGRPAIVLMTNGLWAVASPRSTDSPPAPSSVTYRRHSPNARSAPTIEANDANAARLSIGSGADSDATASSRRSSSSGVGGAGGRAMENSSGYTRSRSIHSLTPSVRCSGATKRVSSRSGASTSTALTAAVRSGRGPGWRSACRRTGRRHRPPSRRRQASRRLPEGSNSRGRSGNRRVAPRAPPNSP